MARTYRGMTSSERHEDRRARLLAAGLATFATTGYAASTIEGLARDAGVTARHVYDHFASREALLIAVYESVLDRHRDAVARALSDTVEATLEGRVRVAIDAALGAWTADPAGARVAFIEIVGVSPLVEARRTRAVAEYTEFVVAVADDLHAQGLARGPGRPIAARAVVGALIGLVELWLTADPPPTTTALADEATTLALAAIERRSGLDWRPLPS